ncbi:hypothetical protein GLOTRDRAFT_126075 [Gloeophyllum trabeum ATCC 11539]|uniref:Uncharacterized protein n=1 Tax=Gloeophyllum trabeum (strain ATCC 11539 / FP-39264 / Madison 617) TaxID=670483 RepID=S7QKK0_GLOTA|nr:uncharacterized protein GLOTRDRAFT_126075 [Gloeophyllum trabeum ATCC 11539]EPQ59778.1 hypothetical protein GLOTRDRAFT_126075 [Gloeophyllum trabeum ATCC 11539]
MKFKGLGKKADKENATPTKVTDSTRNTLAEESSLGTRGQGQSTRATRRYACIYEAQRFDLPSPGLLDNSPRTRARGASSLPVEWGRTAMEQHCHRQRTVPGEDDGWEREMRDGLDSLQLQIKELDDRFLARRMSEGGEVQQCATISRNQREYVLPTPPYSPTEAIFPSVQGSGEPLSPSASPGTDREDLWDLILQFPPPPPLLNLPRHSLLSLGMAEPRPSGFVPESRGLQTPPMTPLADGHNPRRRKSFELESIDQLLLDPTAFQAPSHSRRPLMENPGRYNQRPRNQRSVTAGKENFPVQRRGQA